MQLLLSPVLQVQGFTNMHNILTNALFVQSCPYEEGEDCCTATEDQTGKRSQLKPLENNPFDHQAARALSRDNKLVHCRSACREGQWKRRVHMEEIDLA